MAKIIVMEDDEFTKLIRDELKRYTDDILKREVKTVIKDELKQVLDNYFRSEFNRVINNITQTTSSVTQLANKVDKLKK